MARSFHSNACRKWICEMTYAYLQYAADLLGWTHSPREVHTNWLTDAKQEDLAARLTQAISHGQVRDSLEDLAPTHPQYKGLQAALGTGASAADGHADQIRMNMERWRWAPRDLGDRYILVNVPAYVLQVMEGDRRCCRCGSSSATRSTRRRSSATR
jgi:murein L,D-transpeptidase YcbB/YkuD